MNSNRKSLLWGALLILFGLVMLLETFGVIEIVGRLVWAAILAAIGLPFLLIYLSNRSQWWALFPGCIMTGVGIGVLVGGDVAAIIIVGSVSLPFWLIYFTDRAQWWALIPAWVMACVCVIIALGLLGLDWFIAPFVMFAVAAPFLLVYLVDREQWWALIPGGIMAGIGVLILVESLVEVFTFWPIILIALGLWMVYRAIRPSSTTSAPPSSQFEQPGVPDRVDQSDQPR